MNIRDWTLCPEVREEINRLDTEVATAFESGRQSVIKELGEMPDWLEVREAWLRLAKGMSPDQARTVRAFELEIRNERNRVALEFHALDRS